MTGNTRSGSVGQGRASFSAPRSDGASSVARVSEGHRAQPSRNTSHSQPDP